MREEKRKVTLGDLIFLGVQFLIIAFMFGAAVYYFTKL